MGRLVPPPPPEGPASKGIEYANGITECPHCHERPPAGDPWTTVRIGTTIWPRACLPCGLKHDDRLQPRGDGDA